MVNISKWIHVPYKIARAVMPESFIERFRLHNEDFLSNLLKEIKIEDIPVTLGGKNEVTHYKRELWNSSTNSAKKITSMKSQM